MLTFEEKLSIIESFPELTRKNVSLGRVNYQFEESATDKKNVVYHLHPNGNGFIYAGHLSNIDTDDKGLVNIKDISAEDLKEMLAKVIKGLSSNNQIARSRDEEGDKERPSNTEGQEMRWSNDEGQALIARYEDDLWNIYFGVNLEESFGTFDEVEEYLEAEGFKKA